MSHKCEKCDKKFQTAYKLNRHVNEKLVPCDFVCEICFQEQEHTTNWKKHMEDTHPVEYSKLIIKNNSSKGNLKVSIDYDKDADEYKTTCRCITCDEVFKHIIPQYTTYVEKLFEEDIPVECPVWSIRAYYDDDDLTNILMPIRNELYAKLDQEIKECNANIANKSTYSREVLWRVMTEIHFNPNYPKYHNIYIPNLQTKNALMFDGTAFSMMPDNAFSLCEKLLTRIVNFIEFILDNDELLDDDLRTAYQLHTERHLFTNDKIFQDGLIKILYANAYIVKKTVKKYNIQTPFKDF